MFYGDLGEREPLAEGYVLEFASKAYEIDHFLGAGGFALTYLGHEEGSSNYVVIKELFPRHAEHRVAERRPDGRIVLYDPAVEGPYAERAGVWDEFLPYLSHEARMTRKASEVFLPNGARELQNSPEAFGVDGPFRGKNGNHYLILRTAQGQPLSRLIQDGFVKNESGKIITNGNLTEILEILIKLTQRLSRLHNDNEILHLDLSPENVYVTHFGGGSESVPILIDFGSAYDRTGTKERAGHRYTYNPYSAPEIRALAELNDEGAGYSPDESSDTYSVAAILFYALTGRLFSAQMLFNPSWKRDFSEEYFYSGDGSAAEGSFAKQLISLIEKGLSSNQRRRFLTASDLYKALKSLRRAYEKTGTLLNLVDRDELISYAVLDRFPLYAFRSAGGDLDVLCLGSGEFARRMILNMISCGQMLDGRLTIHIVSNDDPRSVVDALKNAAPMLEAYSNLDRTDVPEEKQYVRFTFDRISDLLDGEACAETAARYAFCRYVLISLGRNNANVDLARMYGKALSAAQAEDRSKALILYYDAEDAAANVRSHFDESGIADNVKLIPFGEKAAAYAGGIRDLGRRACRLSYLYDLLLDPRHPLESSVRSFMSDPYGQRSSCAAALHLKYKLASVGINPAPSTNRRAIIAAYQRTLASSRRNDLLYLEHRRWLMYMVANGYRLPTIRKTDEYSFKGSNTSFKDTVKRWHPCLVPSSRTGLVLSSLPHGEWDKYQSDAEIEETDYDDLDKTSLKLHLLARKKMRESRLLDDMEEVGAALRLWTEYLSEQTAPSEQKGEGHAPPRQFQIEQLRKEYDELYDNLKSLYESGRYAQEAAQLDKLEESFREAGIDAGAAFTAVRNDLAVFAEFSLYRDYKDADSAIVDHLLWLLYADEGVTMLKLSSRAVLDNVISALRIRPSELIYWGEPLAELEDITAFLRIHGNRGTISGIRAEGESLNALTDELAGIVKKHAGNERCVIDITGGDPLLAAAAVKLAGENSSLGIIRYNEKAARIEDVQNFFEAGIYNLETRISANEVYSLFGAVGEKRNDHYMRDLCQLVPKLWAFYQEFQSDWEMVTAFFFSRGKGSPELKLKLEDPPEEGRYDPCTELVDRQCWRDLRTEECFRRLASMGFIRELSAAPRGNRLAVSFLAPTSVKKGALEAFFRDRIYYSKATPFAFDSGKDRDGSSFASLQSGYFVDIVDTSGDAFPDQRRESESGGKSYRYEQVLPALTRLQDLGLIYDLRYDLACPFGDGMAAKLSFVYSDLAVQQCLMREGNILELFAWNAAYQTGYFDDCRPNFSFQWKEGVRNELDLILTKGMSALVLSCKTGKCKKEQLYEIKYLTEKFSLNCVPVMICSSNRTPGEDGRLTEDLSPIKTRAGAMGVYLIDLNETAPEELGQVLVRISKGEYSL